jgi:HK97 family phage prohead protease
MSTTIYKTLSTDVQPVGDRRIRFLISTGSVDRDGDVLDPKGWDLTHYKKSPVVLWAHDYSQMPIAKAVSIGQTAKGLEATAEFPRPGIYPFADTVYDMLKGGFLNATSVGFKPIESESIKGGRKYTKTELLEFSIVPVPANPEALIVRAISTEQVKAWKKMLVGWAEKTTFADAAPSAPVLHPTVGAEDEMAWLKRCVNDPSMREAYPNFDSRYAECSLRWARDCGNWQGIQSSPPSKAVLEISNEGWTLDIRDTLLDLTCTEARLKQLIAEAVGNAYTAEILHHINRRLDYHRGRVS